MEYSLRERVVVVAGPLSTTVQSIMTGLTSEGADVALLNEDAAKAEKFCSQLSDLREVKSKHGRAIAVPTDLCDVKKIQDSVGSVAQTFGGVDVLLDAQLFNEPSSLNLAPGGLSPEWLDSLISKNLKSTLLLTQSVASFLKGRKKGRIIFLMNENVLRGRPEDGLIAAVRSGLVPFAKALGQQLMEHNVTVNVVSLGYTEEYILAHKPGIMIKDSIEALKQRDSSARITEPDKITNALIFLIGSSGTAVTGQTLSLI